MITSIRHNHNPRGITPPVGSARGFKLFMRDGDAFFLTAWVPLGDISANGGGLIYLSDSIPLGRAIEDDFTLRAATFTRTGWALRGVGVWWWVMQGCRNWLLWFPNDVVKHRASEEEFLLPVHDVAHHLAQGRVVEEVKIAVEMVGTDQRLDLLLAERQIAGADAAVVEGVLGGVEDAFLWRGSGFEERGVGPVLEVAGDM